MKIPATVCILAVTICLAIGGCSSQRRGEPTRDGTALPAVLLCDFDDLLGIHGYWQFPRFSSHLSNAIIRRVYADPNRRCDIYRPLGAEGRVSSEIPPAGYDYFVTGTLFLPDIDTFLVVCDVLDVRGIPVASVRLYLPRDADHIADRVSREIAVALSNLPESGKARSLDDINGGLAYASGVRLMERDPLDSESTDRLNKASRFWGNSSEPLRKAALGAWRRSEMDTSCELAGKAFDRVPIGADDQLCCLATVLTEDCAKAGWAHEAALTLAREVVRRHPNEPRSWASAGLLGEATDTKRGMDDLETAVLSNYANGSSRDGSYALISLASSRHARERDVFPSEGNAALAAAALQWRSDTMIGSVLSAHGMSGFNDRRLFKETSGSRSPSVNFVTARWLYQHERPAEGAIRLRRAVPLLRELSPRNGAISRLSQVVDQTLQEGSWKCDAITTTWRVDKSLAVETTTLNQLSNKADALRYQQYVRAKSGLPDRAVYLRTQTLAQRYQEILEAEPLNIEAARALTEMYEQRTHPDFVTAINQWSEIGQTGRGDSFVLLGTGRSHLLRWDQQGNRSDADEAVRLFEKAIEQAPDRSYVCENAAWELAERGVRLEKAALWAETVRRVRSRDARSLCLTGWIAAQSGDLATAERDLKSAVEVSYPDTPDYSDAALRLADVALRSGDVINAKRWLTNTPTGENTFMPADNPYFERTLRLEDSTAPTRIIAAARTIVALYPTDQPGESDSQPVPSRPRWIFPTAGVIWSLAIADIDADGRREVIVGTSCEGSVRGILHVVGYDGKEKWRFKVAASLLNWPDDHMAVRFLSVEDFDGDGQTELLACATHHPWFPSRVCIVDRTGKLKFELWNPGVIENIRSIRFEGHPQIILRGVNNHDNRADGYKSFVARIDLYGRKLAGQNGQMTPSIGLGPSDGTPLGQESFEWRASVSDDQFVTLATSGAVKTAPAESGRVVAPTSLDHMRFALLIGNGESAVAGNLLNTAKDTEGIRNKLVNLGYSDGAVVRYEGRRATKPLIRKAAEGAVSVSLYEIPNIITVHFSGHAAVVPGRSAGSRDVLMILNGCRGLEDTDRSLRLSEIPDLFGPAFLGATFVVTLDACLTDREGSASRAPGRVLGYRIDEQTADAEQTIRRSAKSVRGHRMRVIFGCRPGSEAREYNEIEGGVFSTAIVRTLGGDGSEEWKDSELTDAELLTGVEREMTALLKAIPGSMKQRPFAVQDGPAVSVASIQPGRRR